MFTLLFAGNGGGKTALNFRLRVKGEAITTSNLIPCSAGWFVIAQRDGLSTKGNLCLALASKNYWNPVFISDTRRGVGTPR